MLTKLQKEILNGLMLGDGHIERRPGGRPHLIVGRARKDKNYILYHANIFSSHLSKISDISFYDKRTNKTYYRSTFNLKCSDDFIKPYSIWYKNKKKIVPKNLKLTHTTVATWLADDGCFIKLKYGGCVVKLATHSFEKHEVEFLSKLLYDKYHVNFHIYKDESGKKTAYFLQISNTKEVKIFLRTIDKYFPKGMERKSDMWRNPEFKLFYEKSYPNCKWCSSTKVYKNGKHKGKQKFYCLTCTRQWLSDVETMTKVES